MFEGDFSLEDVKALIITLNVDPTEAVNAITGFLRDNYGKDKKAAILCGGINGNISKNNSKKILRLEVVLSKPLKKF